MVCIHDFRAIIIFFTTQIIMTSIGFGYQSLPCVKFKYRERRHIESFSSHTLFSKELWLDSNGNYDTDVEILKKFPIDKILFKQQIPYSKKDSNFENSCLKYIIKDDKLINNQGKTVGAVIEIDSTVEGQNRALPLVGSVEWIVLKCVGSWTMIPCENLIAACDGSCTKLAVYVDSIEKLSGVLFSLQLGPSAIILQPYENLLNAYMEIKNNGLSKISAKQSPSNVELQTAKLHEAVITNIKSCEIGDRVCLDLIQLLCEGEGLLLGSSSQLMTFVYGETCTTCEFVPARPFRVNAGPVHSYVTMADGSTKYLSEVKAGDTVKVIKLDKFMNCNKINENEEYLWTPPLPYIAYTERSVTVGRCKIEPRPMYMIEYELLSHLPHEKGKSQKSLNISYIGQIFLQQAETVRIVSKSKEASSNYIALPVTDTKIGDKIFVIQNDFGTHVGRRISSKVTEK